MPENKCTFAHVSPDILLVHTRDLIEKAILCSRGPAGLESETFVYHRSAPVARRMYASVIVLYLILYIISVVVLKCTKVQQTQDVCVELVIFRDNFGTHL